MSPFVLSVLAFLSQEATDVPAFVTMWTGIKSLFSSTDQAQIDAAVALATSNADADADALHAAATAAAAG